MPFSNFTFVVLFLCLNNVLSSSKVPLMLWTNIRDLSCDTPVHDLESNIATIFNDDYMECLAKTKPEQVILFVYDQLEIEDITLYGQETEQRKNSFANIKTFMKTPGSLTIPYIEPSNIVEDLFAKFDNIPADVKIKIVRLPAIDRSDSSATSNDLQQIDEDIGKTTTAMNNGRYIAIVTSESTPNRPDASRGRDFGRHLLAVEDDESKNGTKTNSSITYLIGDCVLMSFKSVNLTVKKINPKKTYSTSLDLSDKNEPASFTNEICLPEKNMTKGNVSVTMNFDPASEEFESVSIEMVFNRNFSVMSARYWWKLIEVSINYTTNSSSELESAENTQLNHLLFQNVITAPDNLSYVCSSTEGLSLPNVVKRGQTPLNYTIDLQFKYFQVQPFWVEDVNKSTSYNFAVDCVGWYTAPIWSGLIITFLLISILTFGLGMLSKVTTMDRFDDPKGKTMAVPQEST